MYPKTDAPFTEGPHSVWVLTLKIWEKGGMTHPNVPCSVAYQRTLQMFISQHINLCVGPLGEQSWTNNILQIFVTNTGQKQVWRLLLCTSQKYSSLAMSSPSILPVIFFPLFLLFSVIARAKAEIVAIRTASFSSLLGFKATNFFSSIFIPKRH